MIDLNCFPLLVTITTQLRLFNPLHNQLLGKCLSINSASTSLWTLIWLRKKKSRKLVQTFANLKWYQLDCNDAFSGVNNNRLVRHTPTTCQKPLKNSHTCAHRYVFNGSFDKTQRFEYFNFHWTYLGSRLIGPGPATFGWELVRIEQEIQTKIIISRPANETFILYSR